MSNFVITINSSQNKISKEFLEPKLNIGFKSISKSSFDILYEETDITKCNSYENENNFCFIKYSDITDTQKLERSENDNYAQIAINHFETHGCNFDEIKGDYSIFIFAKKQKKFFVFSDHMSLSPIFYAEIKNTTLITSDLSFILEYPYFKKDLNHTAIKNYLDLETPCTESTFYNGIKKIPPRNLLIISSKGINLKPYKTLKVIPNVNKFGIVKTVETFRDLFLKTVEEYSRSKKRVGLQFSGGLDSSSILVALKNQKSKTKIFSYTARFDSLPEFERKKISEKKYQDGCLKGSNVHSRFYDKTKITTISRLDAYLKIFRQPFYFPNLALIEESYKMAKNDEIDVLMSGMDGDSVLSYGYEYLPHLFKRLSWIKLFLLLQKIKRTHKISFIGALNFYVLKPFLGEMKIFFENNFRKMNTHNSNSIHPSIFHINMMEHANRYDAIEKLKLLGNHYNLLVSHPFYDEDLIDFCISVNPEYKIHNGYSRYVLRESIKNLLPEENYKRITKSDIGICFIYQMREIDNEIIEYNFKNPSVHIKNYLDLDSLLKEWNYFRNSTSYTLDQQTISSKIFVFVCLNVWLKKEFP